MKRSRAFRPSSPDLLEGRLVLSQVLFTPATGIVAARPSHAEVAATAHSSTIHEVGQTKLADGKTLVTDTSITRDGAGGATISKVTHEPDGTSKVVDEVTNTSGGTTTIHKTITLPDGAKQAETGTDQTMASTTTILPDGTLQAHPTATVIASRTTTFTHVITQAGLGTETIVGTTVTQPSRGKSISVTDQEVTHFDGSKDEVKIVTVAHGGSSTTHKATIAPDGTVTTTFRTARPLSSSRS